MDSIEVKFEAERDLDGIELNLMLLNLLAAVELNLARQVDSSLRFLLLLL